MFFDNSCLNQMFCLGHYPYPNLYLYPNFRDLNQSVLGSVLESDQLTSLGESSGVRTRDQFAGTEFCWSVLGRQIALWELRVGGF